MSSSFSDIYYIDDQINSNFPISKNGSAKVGYYCKSANYFIAKFLKNVKFLCLHCLLAEDCLSLLRKVKNTLI